MRQNQTIPMWPKAAVFGPAAISYTWGDAQYICIHGVEMAPYRQFFLGLRATLSFDASFGMARTKPLKDVVGGDAQGAIKKTVAEYYQERLQGHDGNPYASFQDEIVTIIEKLDPNKPILVSGHSMGAALSVPVVAQIRGFHTGKKLAISLINVDSYKSADDNVVEDFQKAGIDASNYNVEGDPVPNMTGAWSFTKGIADTIGAKLALTDQIAEERKSAKTRVRLQQARSSAKTDQLTDASHRQDVGATYIYPRDADPSVKDKSGIALHRLSVVQGLLSNKHTFEKFVRNDTALDQSFVEAPKSGKPELVQPNQTIGDMAPFFRDPFFGAEL